MIKQLNKTLKLNLQELKETGFLQQVQPDRFALRVRVAAGQLTGENLQAIGELAKQYGNGTVHFTSRQSVEVPFIKARDIQAVKALLHAHGLQPGILGARVRTITACQGAAICKHGNIKTTDLAHKLTGFTSNKELPHKFKIGITGCFNNCLKAEENDLGIKGAVQPNWLEQLCTYCGVCAVKCPVAAISVDKQEKYLTYQHEKCINCGNCVKLCPTKAWTGKGGFVIYFGGTFGNRILIGQRLLPIVLTEEELLEVVDKALSFYQAYGKKGERFGYLLERLGVEKLRSALESD
jgi:dissimilatory sulfite reductase (desulfoviridin) alpha/beta subunit